MPGISDDIDPLASQQHKTGGEGPLRYFIVELTMNNWQGRKRRGSYEVGQLERLLGRRSES